MSVGTPYIKGKRWFYCSYFVDKTTEESHAISTLLNDSALVISKVDKDNAVVVMNKNDYLNKEQEILNDKRAFRKLNKNLTSTREKQFIEFLLELKRNKIINPE